MRIEVITVWYNEAFLAPFFLHHYAYADRITLFYDADSNDNSLDIARTGHNVTIIPFSFSAGFSSVEKQRLINNRYAESDADWVLAADADEFVFCKGGEDVFINDVRAFIKAYPGFDIYNASLYSVFPLKGQGPPDPALPAVPQRRHGNPIITPGFHKPLLFRGGLDLVWWLGCHQAMSPEGSSYRQSPHKLFGAHWHKADLDMALQRILLNRVPRIGEDDKKAKYSIHYSRESEASLREEFARFADGPRLF